MLFILDNPIQIQPAAIVILNSSGELVHRYELPAKVRSSRQFDISGHHT